MRSDESAIRLAKTHAYGMTDVGRKRRVNQDQFLIAQLNKSMLVTSTSLPLNHRSRLYGGIQGLLFLVADGMGGHAAGEKASSLAIDNLITQLLNSVHWFFQIDHDCEEDFIEDLKELLKNTHRRILSESAVNAEQQGMGTTLTMAHVVWPRLYVVHAGDSRCYLIRGGECQQLTTDHTLARKLVESGGLKPEDEATSRWSNVLWNVLGGQNEDGDLIAEVRRATLEPGDTILLCSDGLYRYLDEATLASVVSGSDDLPAICQDLINRANDAGGEDNITVVLARPCRSQLGCSESAMQSSAGSGETNTNDSDPSKLSDTDPLIQPGQFAEDPSRDGQPAPGPESADSANPRGGDFLPGDVGPVIRDTRGNDDGIEDTLPG
ncbi:PP2C family protein-serine/threonine phosphatase [Crateriforma spongiae]|uniref:PP2C family protein-serine/threonine phosphatase n=1 Tax=Crateriforma spongiae TaxID=2724528 RepID=UPI00144669CC|nr:protein phosphatase 2C domain-containing protein [Crateriforma spongiae]